MFTKAVVFIGGVVLGAYAMYNHLFRKAVYAAATSEDDSENTTEETETTEE